MMESYIAVLTKGICQSEENGSFLSKDFDARKAYLAGSIKGKKGKNRPGTVAHTCNPSEPRLCHCTPIWATRQDSVSKRKKERKKSTSPNFPLYDHWFVYLFYSLSVPLSHKLPEGGTGSVILILYLECLAGEYSMHIC